MSVTYVSSLILNTIICCLVSIPYKQCNSTKAGMQHSHLCNPPPSRLFESVWGTWIQQLCSHQRWCPGFWQTEAVHLCVSTLPDKRYVVTGYNRLQVKDGWSLLIWKMKSIKSSLKSAFFLIASRVQLFWLHKRYTVCIIKSMLKTFSSPDVPSDWFKVLLADTRLKFGTSLTSERLCPSLHGLHALYFFCGWTHRRLSWK